MATAREKSVREKWRMLKATLDERARRLWAGSEAHAIGWGGVTLRTYETIVSLIGNTTNRGGLLVQARLDRRNYPIGRKVSAKQMRELKIEREDFHGDWNYVIRPRNEMR